MHPHDAGYAQRTRDSFARQAAMATLGATLESVEPGRVVLAAHRAQLEQQMADLDATLDEVRAHEKEARRLLAEGERRKGG